MKSLIVIHPDETITHDEYAGLESLQKNVGGYIELGGIRRFKIENKEMEITFYCDEEFLLKNDNKYCIVNALASLLVNNTIYGNVVIIPTNKNGEDMPFDNDETVEIEKQLSEYAKTNTAKLKKLHCMYDGIIRL